MIAVEELDDCPEEVEPLAMLDDCNDEEVVCEDDVLGLDEEVVEVLAVDEADVGLVVGEFTTIVSLDCIVFPMASVTVRVKRFKS